MKERLIPGGEEKGKIKTHKAKEILSIKVLPLVSNCLFNEI
jgi:hypothetical protein